VKPNGDVSPRAPVSTAGYGVTLPRPTVVAATITAVLLVVALAHLLFSSAAPAPSPESRAHAIGERLACPICQGLSIADSPSTLAQQMRGVIRDQVAAGETDDQIQRYFVARYGPSILLVPPAHGFTLLVWWVPVILALAGAAVACVAAFRLTRRGSSEDSVPRLSPDDERHYAKELAVRLAESSDPADLESGPLPRSDGSSAPNSSMSAVPMDEAPRPARPPDVATEIGQSPC